MNSPSFHVSHHRFTIQALDKFSKKNDYMNRYGFWGLYLNGEGVFKVRAAQPYHKNFEVATTPPPPESLSRIYPIRVFYLPGVSNVFHIIA